MEIIGIADGTVDESCEMMCKEALLGAREAGAEITFVRFQDYTISMSEEEKGQSQDEFERLVQQILKADGVCFSNPASNQGLGGQFRIFANRLEHRLQQMECKKVISFMGMGQSDQGNGIQTEHAKIAMNSGWKIIDNDWFPWSKLLIMKVEKLARAHQIGVNLAMAAKNIAEASYQGEEGICPHCNCNQFYINPSTTHATCCACGIEGEIRVKEGRLVFDFPQSQLEHAYDTGSGQEILRDKTEHKNKLFEEYSRTEEYKKRMEKYQNFQNRK
ncbi:MAG: NAD(P)H-dependent oxidoreductase [Lachnospiraceae bacterium]